MSLSFQILPILIMPGRHISVSRPRLTLSRSHSNPVRRRLLDQDGKRAQSLDRQAEHQAPDLATWRWKDPDGFGDGKKTKTKKPVARTVPEENVRDNPPTSESPTPSLSSPGKRFSGFEGAASLSLLPVAADSKPPDLSAQATLFLGSYATQTWSRCPVDRDSKVPNLLLTAAL